MSARTEVAEPFQAEVAEVQVGVRARCEEILQNLLPSEAEQVILSAIALGRIKDPNSEWKQMKTEALCSNAQLNSEDMENLEAIIKCLAELDPNKYRAEIEAQLLAAQIVVK